VSKWAKRFAEDWIEGLRGKTGRVRKLWLPVDKVAAVIDRLHEPPQGRTRWSTDTMAKALGRSPYSVHQIWVRNVIKPHQTRIFKLSSDQKFEEKSWASSIYTSTSAGGHWCSAVTRRASVKPWSGRSQQCPWARDTFGPDA
jgi:hypothetical protein